jgi:hypothetical protein
MNKEFIPYEQALKLKELGFDEPCLSYYDKEEKLCRSVLEYPIINSKNGFHQIYNIITAPLYQQAFRWFRDKKLSDASINRHGEADGRYSYRWEIVHEYGVYEERHFKMGYKTYEEAELACLKELIKLSKKI